MAEKDNDAVVAQYEAGEDSTEISRKMEPTSPKKRNRPYLEEHESAFSPAKRQKGVAPIKAE